MKMIDSLKLFCGVFIISAPLLICPSCVDSASEAIAAPSRIIIVPDIQNYMEGDRVHYLDAIADFCVDNANDYAACFQVGDLTNNNRISQYRFDDDHFFSRFSKGHEPFFCLGNHDYGSSGSADSRTTQLPLSMAPVCSFRKEGCLFENYVRFLSIGDKDYGLLELEFAPRNETLIWANDVVRSYSVPFILLTHAFTNEDGQLYDSSNPNESQRGNPKSYTLDNDYINDGLEIFNKLIYNNPNIIMVVCGHSLVREYIDVTSKENIDGNRVCIITVNYQHYKDGGCGYVGILDFLNDYIRISDYSTVDHMYGQRVITFYFNQPDN